MLFFVVAIAFLAAANAAHITTVEEVNKLIDISIVELRQHKRIEIPGFNNADVTGLEHLKRDGNCVKKAAAGTFECKAIATEAVVSAEGDKMEVTVHFTFAVVVNDDGHLTRFEIETVDIVPNGDIEVFYGLLKKIWNKVKAAAVSVVKKKADNTMVNVTQTLIPVVIG